MRTPGDLEPAPAKREPYQVNVVLKALDVLESIAGRESMGLTELSLETGSNKASVYRILATLEARGFVTKDADSRRYQVGPRLVAIASQIVDAIDIVRVTRPALEELREEFKETINLAALIDGSVEYLEVLEGRGSLRMAARRGS